MPVMAAVVRFTRREAARRKNVSCRFCRTVPTTSFPASIAATTFGISSGGFWRSASSVMTYSPSVAVKAAKIAMCCPAFRTSSTTLTVPGFAAAAAFRISSERSREPSSTKTTSQGRPIPLRTGSRRGRSCGRFASSL
jgi:hypothetical protein